MVGPRVVETLPIGDGRNVVVLVDDHGEWGHGVQLADGTVAHHGYDGSQVMAAAAAEVLTKGLQFDLRWDADRREC